VHNWREGSERPTPQAFLARQRTAPNTICDGANRKISVIIGRFD
jgi:hypothetical protein